MAFTLQNARGRGQGGRRRRDSGFCEINVTPLVDVMLVLLVVFMITAPMMTVGVPLDLPKTKAATLTDQSDPVIVSVDSTGKSYLNETELAGEALIARLMVVTESNPEARIFIRGDSQLAYGRVMEVLGEINAAGFTKVSLLAEPLQGGASKKVQMKQQGAPKVIPTAAQTPQGLPTLHSIMPSSTGSKSGKIHKNAKTSPQRSRGKSG